MRIGRGTVIRRRLMRCLIWAAVVVSLLLTAGLWVAASTGRHYAAFHDRKTSASVLASIQVCFQDSEIAFIQQEQTIEQLGTGPPVNWQVRSSWGFGELVRSGRPAAPPPTASQVSCYFVWPKSAAPIDWGSETWPKISLGTSQIRWCR